MSHVEKYTFVKLFLANFDITSLSFRSRILIDVGNGLLCRCYYSLHIFTKDAPAFLQSAELKKVRDKVEKQFPEPDIGNAKVRQKNTTMTRHLLPSNRLQDMNCLWVKRQKFPKNSCNLKNWWTILQNIPKLLSPCCSLSPVTSWKSRLPSRSFDNIAMFHFALQFFSSHVEARKESRYIVALFGPPRDLHACDDALHRHPRQKDDLLSPLCCGLCGEWIAKQANKRVRVVEHLPLTTIDHQIGSCRSAVILFRDGEHLQRHFIDSFVTCYVLLRPLMCQLQDSLAVYEDCDSLRNSFTLNPINDGDKLGLPSQKKVRILAYVDNCHVFACWARKQHRSTDKMVLVCLSS